MQSVPLSPHELVLLAAERTVTVTREEHHQDVLAGRAGRVVVELRPSRITAGKHAGHDGLEVALDGRRVGELTRLMAQRYRPMVDDIRARGYRAGCEALLRDDLRGVQVELRLPAGTERRVPEPPTVAVPAGAPRWPARVPPRPTAVLPGAVPQQRPRPPATSPATGRRRPRRLLGVAGAVVGVLVLASALGNDTQDEVPTGSSSALPTALAAPPRPTETAAVPTTTSAAAVEPVVEPADVAVAEPVVRATTSTRSRSSASTTTRPTSRTVEPVPEAAPKPEPQPEPQPEPEAEQEPSGCDPNYGGCVPIARDVDCAGGQGDGPAYVEGPVQVIGSDIYGLDRGGEPGVGCE